MARTTAARSSVPGLHGTAMVMKDSRLISIHEVSDLARLDIVFIHGITGGPITSWNGLLDIWEASSEIKPVGRDEVEPANDDAMGGDFWPLWIKEALEDKCKPHKTNVWTVGYPAPLFKHDDPFAYNESLKMAFIPCVRQMVRSGIGQGRNRGVVFICHSLGGLAVKAMLAHCHRSADDAEKRILLATCGVAFLGTPHAGSGLATLMSNLPELLQTTARGVKVVSWIAGVPVLGDAIKIATRIATSFADTSNAVKWLAAADPQLRELAVNYRHLAREHGIDTKAYYETQSFAPKKGRWLVRALQFIHLYPKNLLWIVNASNADPGIVDCDPTPVLNCDHLTICKPANDASTMYRDLEAWLKRLLNEGGRGIDSAFLGKEILDIHESIQADNSNYAGLLEKWPPPQRHLEAIKDGDTRKALSHAFRREAVRALTGKLGERLRDESGLLKNLENSDWDLDLLVLYIWRKLQFKNECNKYMQLLDNRMSWMDQQYEMKQPLSLIPTFRLVDSLREACGEGLLALRERFETTRKWIQERESTGLDGNRRTRTLLESGYEALKHAQDWPKPP
jgi:hypothetical protein